MKCASAAHRHRSPLVKVACIEDYLAGVPHPLSVVYTHPSVGDGP